MGGGHGPFSGWAGLGVDNFVEAEIVLADGTLVTVRPPALPDGFGFNQLTAALFRAQANETHNRDLHWALRGGGGSTWGVLTRLTLRAHTFPATGFHERNAVWLGDACAAGKAHLHQIIDEYLGWALTLDSRWNGLVWVENRPGKALVSLRRDLGVYAEHRRDRFRRGGRADLEAAAGDDRQEARRERGDPLRAVRNSPGRVCH